MVITENQITVNVSNGEYEIYRKIRQLTQDLGIKHECMLKENGNDFHFVFEFTNEDLTVILLAL